MTKKEIVKTIVRIRKELFKPDFPAWKFMRLHKSELISQLSFYQALKDAGGKF